MARTPQRYSEETYKQKIDLYEDKKIAFHVMDDHGSFSPGHWHEAIEIIYILEGTTIVNIFDQSVTMHPGQFMLVNSGVVHSTRCPEKNRAILIQIPDEFLASYLPDTSTLWFSIDFASKDPVVQEDIRKLDRLLLSMKDLQEDTRPGYLLPFHRQLFDFLDLLYRKFLKKMPVNYHPKSSRILSRLDAVITYTHRHYTAPISLKEAAEVAALQPEYFCRFFRQNMGMTYLQYLNDYRLSRIYRDLIATELSIQELQEKHGFTNDKLFHRLFRDRFQTTPLKIRKAARAASLE